jgi:hypothetical protein
VGRPGEDREIGPLTLSPRRRRRSSWVFLPITFFLGGALALALSANLGGHTTTTLRRLAVAPAAPAPQTAPIAQLLIEEAHERDARRIRGERARAAQHAGTVDGRALARSARVHKHGAKQQAQKPGPAVIAPQSAKSERPSTHETKPSRRAKPERRQARARKRESGSERRELTRHRRAGRKEERSERAALEREAREREHEGSAHAAPATSPGGVQAP